MVSAYNNAVCVYVKCDGFEFPLTVQNAKELILELQTAIDSIQNKEKDND